MRIGSFCCNPLLYQSARPVRGNVSIAQGKGSNATVALGWGGIIKIAPPKGAMDISSLTSH